MRLVPLQQFICDTCGELIASPANGWLEWRKDADGTLTGFRIVHHATASPRQPPADCYYPEKIKAGDMHLDSYLGPDGLVRLTAFLVPPPAERVDIEGLVEVIRRLHIPQYEEARAYWRQATDDGFFDGANEHFPYIQSTLETLLDEYRSPE